MARDDRRAGSRSVDWLLGGLFTILPLVPSGPRYLGFGAVHYTLAWVLGLVGLWGVVSLREGRRRVEHPALTLAGRRIVWAWGAFLVVVSGALLVALSVEVDVRSPGFPRLLDDLPLRMWRPYHMYAHPLHPFERWLMLVQGGVVFFAVRDLCARAIEPGRRAGTALRGWLVGYVLVATFAIVQYLTEFQLHPIWVEYSSVVRSHATLETPNMLATYLVLGMGLAYGMARTPGEAGRRLGMAALVLGGGAVVTTMSRAAGLACVATIGLAVGCGPVGWQAFFPVAGPRLRRAVRLLLLAVGLIGIATFLVRLSVLEPGQTRGSSTTLGRLADTLDPRTPLTAVLSHRVDWWTAAIHMSGDYPAVGVGLGRYPRLMASYTAPGVPRENAHSIWLQTLAETGVVGLVTLAALVVAIGHTLLMASVSSRSRAPALAAGSLLGVTAFFLTCTTENQWLLGSAQVTLATLLGACVVASADPDGDGGEAAGASRDGERRWRRLSITLILTAVVCYTVAAMVR